MKKEDNLNTNTSKKENRKALLFVFLIIAIVFCSYVFSSLWITSTFEQVNILVRLSHISTRFLVCFSFIAVSLVFFSYFFMYGENSRIGKVKKLYEVWINLSCKKSIILLFLGLSITCIFVFGKILIDKNVYIFRDIGADTINQYVPAIDYTMNNLKNFSFDSWAMEYGFGANIVNVMIPDPIMLVCIAIGAFFGNTLIPILLIVHKIAAVILSAVFAYKFLSLFSKNYYVVAIVSYVYAFNGFATIWGQHYVFTVFPVYAILAIYCVEKYLREKSNKCCLSLIIVSFLSMANSVYMTYMLFIMVAIYATIRSIVICNRFKAFFTKMLNLALNIIIGFVGGLVIQICNIEIIQNSGRVNASGSLFERIFSYMKQWFLSDDLWYHLQRFISGNLYGIGSKFNQANQRGNNYYEAPQLFFSVLCIIVIFQFIFTIHKSSESLKTKMCLYISFCLMVCLIFNNGFAYVMNSFGNTATRFMFVIFPIMALMMLFVLDNIIYNKIFSIVGLILGGAATLYVLVQPLFSLDGSKKALLVRLFAISCIVCLIVGAVALVMLFVSKDLKKRNYLISILAIAVLVNVSCETFCSINRKGLMPQVVMDRFLSNKSSEYALDELKKIDDQYYRLERTYYDWNNSGESLINDYKGISVYNNAMSNDVKFFNKYYMNENFLSYVHYRPRYDLSPYDITQYSMLGVKYILSKYPTQNTQNYELVSKVGDIGIYKNKNVNSFTTFYSQCITEKDFVSLNYIDKSKLLSNTMIIEDDDSEAFSEYITNSKEVIDDYQNVDVTNNVLQDYSKIIAKHNEQLIIPCVDGWGDSVDGQAYIEMSVVSNEKKETEMFFDTGNGYSKNNKYSMKFMSGNELKVRYPISLDTKQIRIDCPQSGLEITSFRIMSTTEGVRPMLNPSSIEDKGKDSYLEGTIDTDRDGLLFIPIPYNDDWSIKVDGVDTEVYKANSCFMAIKITEGSHSFVIEYKSKAQKIGYVCFGLSLVATLAYWCITNKRFPFMKPKKQKSV